LRQGDWVRIEINCRELQGRVDFVGEGARRFAPDEGAAILARRTIREDLACAAGLPDDTRLWAALQAASGGTWGGCVYDVPSILSRLEGK
jgi:xylonate dehydratase